MSDATARPDSAVLWLAASLAVGTVGGFIAAWAHVPLPWMLGSMGACLVAVMAGVPLARPRKLVDPMRIVLGVMLGGTLKPELLDRLGEITISVALLVPYIAVCTFVGFVYFRKVGNFSRGEALFSATPGGIFTMTAFAEDMGVDIRRIALIQAARILLVVATLPFAIRLMTGAEGLSSVLPTEMRLIDVTALDAVVLTAAGITGWLLARALKVPGATIVGPMVVSSVLHLTGLTESVLPAELAIAAQIVLGVSIGTIFIGTSSGAIAKALLLASGFVAAMLGVTVGVALVAQALTGVELYAGIIAYAPGGLTEMSLVALGMGFSVGYVATLHLLRIVFIALLVPVFLKFYTLENP